MSNSNSALMKTAAFVALLVGLGGTTTQAQDVTHPANVFVNGQLIVDLDTVLDESVCIGNTCSNVAGGETYLNDETLRLKYTQLSIQFVDTSSAPNPNNDWTLRINDPSASGINKFAVEDDSAGTTPFTIEAGLPDHALYVEADGDVGFGTNNPAMALHVVDGDSPAIRLQQDTSNGFAAQTWDIAGNDTNFFVRDVTGGSTLPIRIESGAPSNMIYIDGSDDRVGISTDAPAGKLHVFNTDASAAGLQVTNTGTNANLMRLEATNATATGIGFVMDPSGGPNFWQFTATANENIFRINRSGGNGTEFELNQNGNLTITGTLTQGSDKNAKTAIEPIDNDDILAKVMALPVSSWTYKAEAETGTRHIGPMAQDFYALFGTGADERGISTLDSSGVALAAIQALAEQNAAQLAEIDTQRTTNTDQQALIAELSMRIERLEYQLQASSNSME